MNPKTVVLADDLAPVLTTVADLLQGSLDVIEMASDGPNALDSILTLEPHFAVLDISPGRSGLEVAQKL
jgi:CheY-like chemotaxis protein